MRNKKKKLTVGKGDFEQFYKEKRKGGKTSFEYEYKVVADVSEVEREKRGTQKLKDDLLSEALKTIEMFRDSGEKYTATKEEEAEAENSYIRKIKAHGDKIVKNGQMNLLVKDEGDGTITAIIDYLKDMGFRKEYIDGYEKTIRGVEDELLRVKKKMSN